MFVICPPDLETVTSEATGRWVKALGDSRIIGTLEGVGYEIADLPGSLLGQTESDTIRLDETAAAWSWFVDTSPGDDSEFQNERKSREEMIAIHSAVVALIPRLTAAKDKERAARLEAGLKKFRSEMGW